MTDQGESGGAGAVAKRGGALFAFVLSVAGCVGPPPSPTSSEPGVVRVEIPTATAEAPGVTCAGAQYDGAMTLAGRATSAPPVWLEWRASKVSIVFPIGYYATFEPTLVIHDPAGAPVVHEGEDANRNPDAWPGLFVCVSGNPPTVRAYRRSDVEPPPAATASTSPSAPPTALTAVRPDVPITYSDQAVLVWVSAFTTGDKTAPAEALPVASATIDFGDGTTGSVTQACASPAPKLPLRHRYMSAADYSLSVIAATVCEPGWLLDLDTGEGVRVLAAAAPDTASWPTCSTDQLRMTDGGTGAGLGNVATLIHLANVSATGCNLEGYPGLQLVGKGGAQLPLDLRDAVDGAYMFSAMTVGRVALAPGDVASIELGYGDNPSGDDANKPYDVACPPAVGVRVILPDTHEYGTAAAHIAPCSGWMVVSPVYPGTGWIGFP